jgi:hypothetical protein
VQRPRVEHERETGQRAGSSNARIHRAAPAEGHDVLLLGHFHEPRRLAVRGGEVRLLDTWFKSRRIALV